MPTLTLTLDEEQARLAQALIAKGSYEDLGALLREAFRLLDQREEVLDELRAEIRKGEESGFLDIEDLDGFFEELMAKNPA